MLAKRCQSQCCKLEMLSAKRDADDGDAKDDSEHQMCHTNPNASQEYPEDVHDDTEASSGLWGSLNSLSKRAESQEAELQGLDAEGDTNDGNHHSQTGNDILNGSDDTTQEQPKYIHQYAHLSLIKS